MIKLWRWYVPQKFSIADSVISELKSTAIRTLPYIFICVSNIFPRILRWFEIRFLWGLYEQHNRTFFLRKFNYTKILSKFFKGVMLIIFVDISSQIKRRKPPPWELLSHLNGRAYPSILNCACGKEESSFVSETIKMSMLSFTILDNISNLFLIELMFICPITTLVTLFIRIFFKIPNGPSSQLLSIVLKVSVGFIGFKSKSHFG